MNKHKKLKAFSLINTAIAIVIAGIITSASVYKLLGMVVKAKQTEAKNQLNHLQSLQKVYYYEFARYSDNLETLDYEQEALVTEDGTARYKIEIVDAGNTSFTARATSVEDFDGDGVFNVWEINQDKKPVETQKD